jgi:DNA-binding NtrC family response regulator
MTRELFMSIHPAPRANVLIVDDELLIRQTLDEFLTQEGFAVTTCGSGEEAMQRAAETRFEVALCDVQLPGIDGIELLNRLLQINPETFVILITAYATVENAVEAFQRGAHDYFMKPIILDEVLAKINRLLTTRELYRENQWLRRELSREYDPNQIIGVSPAMRRVREMIHKIAPSRSTVLITGESGTGKELVARGIHELMIAGDSRNPPAPAEARFLAVNCAAIPHDLLENQLFGHRRGAFTGADRDRDGVFVHAGPGTVFLDEIGELPMATQAKLLRALEQKEVMPVGANEPITIEARMLAATNKDLRKEVELGRFRDDLYYRLNVVRIDIPPLRERREDIPVLIEFLLARHARSMGKRFTGVSHETMQILLACEWKGNIRELDNALQRAVIFGEGPLVLPGDLPPDLQPIPDDPGLVDDLIEATRRFERRHIERVLRQAGDKREAARRMNVSLSSLYRKIEQLEIQTKDDAALRPV